MMNEGDKVKDSEGNEGTVTMAYNGQYEIKWANGQTGSFTEEQLPQNGITTKTKGSINSF